MSGAATKCCTHKERGGYRNFSFGVKEREFRLGNCGARASPLYLLRITDKSRRNSITRPSWRKKSTILPVGVEGRRWKEIPVHQAEWLFVGKTHLCPVQRREREKKRGFNGHRWATHVRRLAPKKEFFWTCGIRLEMGCFNFLFWFAASGHLSLIGQSD